MTYQPPKAWSYSRYDTYATCPLKFKLKFIDKAADDTSPAMARGKQLHLDIAGYIGLARESRPDVKYQHRLMDELRGFDNKVIEQQWGFTDQWKPTGWFGKDTWYRQICDVAVLYDDNVAEAIDWKGLALGTPIMTPGGFVRMADLTCASKVFGTDGRPYQVTGKSKIKNLRCFEISFKCNAPPVVCDEEHLWQVRRRTPGSRHYEVVVPVAEVEPGDFIEAASPVRFPRRRLPIHPYVLGCWLGDGHKRDGMISKPDAELYENIEKCGYPVRPIQKSSKMGRTVEGLRGELRELGLLGNKHVPSVYLTASVEQRVDLVQGMMDTDGTWNKKRRRAGFCSCDEHLSRSLAAVVASLGESPSIQKVVRKGFGLTVDSWEVWWTPVLHKPFRLTRKAELVETGKVAGKRNGYYVKEIRQVASVPTQCIAVDSPNHMYLAGEWCIPTHNTGKRYGSNDDQVELQSVGIFARFPVVSHVTTRLAYLDNDITEIAEFPRASFEPLKKKWEDKVRPMMTDTTFLPRPNETCGRCVFGRSKGGQCRFG